MRLLKRIQIVLLVAIISFQAYVQQVNGQNQTELPQNDEQLLMSYLSQEQISSEDKILAENLIKRGQVFSIRYERQEPIEDDSDRQNRQALVDSLNGKGIFATPGELHSDGKIYPSISANFSKFSTYNNPDPKNWLEQMKIPINAGYELKSVHIVYQPSTEIKKQSFEISQKVIAQILAEIGKIKSEYKQLSDYDNVKISDGKWEDRDWPSSYPNSFYRYGYGKEIPNAKGLYEKTTENWCNIEIGFEAFKGFPQAQARAGKTFSRQGIKASWIVESGNEEFNRNVSKIIIKCLVPLDRYEEELESRPVYIVIPTYELDRLIEKYEKGPNMTEQQKRGFEKMRMDWLELKENGQTKWGSQNWMKEPDYYKSLDTSELVEECFSRSIFANEMTIYNDPAVGLESLKIFHNGFAELFDREDLWKGILHLYDVLSSKLDPEADLGQIVRASGHINALQELYGLSPLREQVKGKEEIFLVANLRTLKRFVWYLENYDSEKMGGSPGFFREPCTVAQVALLLAKQVNPQKYAEIITPITSVHWTQEQKVDELKAFLELVISSLEGFVT